MHKAVRIQPSISLSVYLTNRKKELLSREDLELPWKPLYDLYDTILFSKTEHLSLNWFPKYDYFPFFMLLTLSHVFGHLEWVHSFLLFIFCIVDSLTYCASIMFNMIVYILKKTCSHICLFHKGKCVLFIISKNIVVSKNDIF